ncbi:pyridoxamine 5'-phosphate oxidase family protein [Kribbella sp. NPDC048915]|uniref:pyridoxamine 5'-phosphate oxidase family protein n=1 Tax=Kribbella sp. NPDC048915 TaxID=3155148 RepID=UPI00340CD156
MTQAILDERAAAVIEANKYLVLGTVGSDGLPWVTPVYFTPDGHDTFYWVSSPDALHSRNVAERPDVSIAIFDSSVPIGGASAVYFRAEASQVPDDDLEQCVALYAARYPELRAYTLDELHDDIRLYRARRTASWVLVTGRDPEYGTGVDSRRPVWSR